MYDLDQIILTIDWDLFSNRLDILLEKGRDLMTKEKTVKSEDALKEIRAEISSWINDCQTLLKTSFDKDNNKLEWWFRSARHRGYNIPGASVNIHQEIKNEFLDLKTKHTDLWGTKRLLSVCDSVIRPSHTEIRNRQAYSNKRKLELILDKLYDLYDDNHYPIKELLLGNGIHLRRSHEERDLAIHLERLELITTAPGEYGLCGQLTLDGSLHVENKRKVYQESYEDIFESKEDINKRIDEVIAELRKLGLGQEIIYNEIDELKEVYVKLNNKKTWAQTLKGKLWDIALSQALDKDVLASIYEQLTTHQLRLS